MRFLHLFHRWTEWEDVPFVPVKGAIFMQLLRTLAGQEQTRQCSVCGKQQTRFQ